MKILLKTFSLTVVGSLFVGSALATAPQVQLTITAANPEAYAVIGKGYGVYTSPYTFTVGTGSAATTGVFLTCDDFADDVSLGESWLANETSLQNDILPETSLNGTVEFGKTVADQQARYQEVAYLAADLMQWAATQPTRFGNQTAAEYSFAIWDIFDPTGIATFLSVPATDLSGHVLNNFAADVAADVAAAQNFVNGGGAVANELIYTPVPGTPGPPQEFVQVWGSNAFAPAAEPFFVAGLVIDLMFVFGLVAILRRRFSAGR